MNLGKLVWLGCLALVAWAANTSGASDTLVLIGVPGLLVTLPFVFGCYDKDTNR